MDRQSVLQKSLRVIIFDVLLSHRRSDVLLLAPNHYYRVEKT
jgi:hypothetical protein